MAEQKLWTEDIYIKYLDELAKRGVIPDYPKLRNEERASSHGQPLASNTWRLLGTSLPTAPCTGGSWGMQSVVLLSVALNRSCSIRAKRGTEGIQRMAELPGSATDRNLVAAVRSLYLFRS